MNLLQGLTPVYFAPSSVGLVDKVGAAYLVGGGADTNKLELIGLGFRMDDASLLLIVTGAAEGRV